MDPLRTTLFKDRNPRPLVWTKNAEQHPRKPQAVFHTPDSGHSHRVPTTETSYPETRSFRIRSAADSLQHVQNGR